MQATLIRVSIQTKKSLDGLKIHPRETYDDVVQRLMQFHKDASKDKPQSIRHRGGSKI